MSNLGSGQVNFLQEARLDKAQSLHTEDSIEDLEEEEEEKQVKRRKKVKKVNNVYQFFEEMRQMGLRPPPGHQNIDMDLT